MNILPFLKFKHFVFKKNKIIIKIIRKFYYF